ncbi:unnamed protein product, partial [Musa textilis]
YGRYVPVRQDTGTRTALYRAVHIFWPIRRRTDRYTDRYRGVPTDTEVYRSVRPSMIPS